MADLPLTVLGAGGFIGGHLVRHLAAQGLACDAPARDDRSWLQRPLGDVVYAIGLTADFRQRPLDTVQAHVCLLRELLAQGHCRSLTYLSSTRVYAGAPSAREDQALSVDPQQPGDLYNLSKLMGESLCLHGSHGLARVVRLSNIVGLRPDPDIFIDQLLEEGRATGRVRLRTALAARKDYLWIDDAVAQLARIAHSDATGIYNLGSGEAVANAEIAAALEREMGFAVSVDDNAPAWGFTPLDMGRTQARFPFTPRRFGDYFPDFLRQYRQLKGL